MTKQRSEQSNHEQLMERRKLRRPPVPSPKKPHCRGDQGRSYDKRIDEDSSHEVERQLIQHRDAAKHKSKKSDCHDDSSSSDDTTSAG